MSRRQKNLLRPLDAAERQELDRLSRSHSEPASHVARAKALQAVAQGTSYTAAARLAGRKSGDAVSHLVQRFNVEGLQALVPRHGGGPQIVYGPAERERILAEVRRQPDRERDGTATWSVTRLQHTLRQQGMPQISTYTIWQVFDRGWLSLATTSHLVCHRHGVASTPRDDGLGA